VDTALLKLEERGGIRDGFVIGASEDTFCEIVVWRRKGEVEQRWYGADAKSENGRQEIADEDLVGCIPSRLSKALGIAVKTVAFQIFPSGRVGFP
jgi:hypothetical protein